MLSILSILFELYFFHRLTKWQREVVTSYIVFFLSNPLKFSKEQACARVSDYLADIAQDHEGDGWHQEEAADLYDAFWQIAYRKGIY